MVTPSTTASTASLPCLINSIARAVAWRPLPLAMTIGRTCKLFSAACACMKGLCVRMAPTAAVFKNVRRFIILDQIGDRQRALRQDGDTGSRAGGSDRGGDVMTGFEMAGANDFVGQ